VDDNKIVIII